MSVSSAPLGMISYHVITLAPCFFASAEISNNSEQSSNFWFRGRVEVHLNHKVDLQGPGRSTPSATLKLPQTLKLIYQNNGWYS